MFFVNRSHCPAWLRGPEPSAQLVFSARQMTPEADQREVYRGGSLDSRFGSWASSTASRRRSPRGL